MSENPRLRCSTCGEIKPAEEFHIRHAVKRGRSYVCRKCCNKYQRAYRQTPQGKASKLKSVRGGGKWGYLRGQARKNGWECTLTKEEYFELLKQPCYYCGGPLPIAGRGLDRGDNTKGYTPENSVPCCTNCNTIKSNQFSKLEMKLIMTMIQTLREGAGVGE